MARGQARSRGACAGCGGCRARLEPERTDVEALTDVSGTDAGFAKACTAVWTSTRVVFFVFFLLYSIRVSVQGYLYNCVLMWTL